MLIFFLDCRVVVHKEFVPQSQTEHQDVYESAPQLLRDFFRRRNPEVWATCKWFLLHDSARPRTALSVQKLVSRHHITVWLRAPGLSP